jgi:hypothetical protein
MPSDLHLFIDRISTVVSDWAETDFLTPRFLPNISGIHISNIWP